MLLLIIIDLLKQTYQYIATDESIARQRREKTKITGDMKPLSDELTSILSDLLVNKKIDLNLKSDPKTDALPYNPLMLVHSLALKMREEA